MTTELWLALLRGHRNRDQQDSRHRLGPYSSMHRAHPASVHRSTDCHSAGCQPEGGLLTVVFCASFAVSGPRSFSYTTLSWVTTNVITPDDRYSAGYAMKANPGIAPLFGCPLSMR